MCNELRLAAAFTQIKEEVTKMPLMIWPEKNVSTLIVSGIKQWAFDVEDTCVMFSEGVPEHSVDNIIELAPELVINRSKGQFISAEEINNLVGAAKITIIKGDALENVIFLFCGTTFEKACVEIDQLEGFDDKHGTDTSGIAETDVHQSSYTRYVPTPASVVTQVLSSLALDKTQFTFIDVGCGKGRVIALAALEPFKRCIGIELSPDLAAIAQQNMSIIESDVKAEIVEIQCANILVCEFAPEDTVFFLYNPFELVIFSTFVDQVYRNVHCFGKKVQFVLIEDNELSLHLASRDWLKEKQRFQPAVGHHYDVIIFNNF
ncbi:hypothetical protein PULV_a3982 [Pseudoalteromonas ulvae UL12]|uniref:class I SAM-dependent methyltransferase n=1 Tax=Pseudoalteromonas ulvae TaxID=107327 RepID=UPI00186B7B90|nr:class I SAM-dependent methyltransferase [Pseudoalteromonas ulvae]MBE0362175.1 hypothetical protein [Pseudoalteromonas ulvae UL12]